MEGYRTVLVMGAAAILPAVELALTVLQMQEIADIIPDDYWPYYSVLVGLLGVYLRLITTTPVGKKT